MKTDNKLARQVAQQLMKRYGGKLNNRSSIKFVCERGTAEINKSVVMRRVAVSRSAS